MERVNGSTVIGPSESAAPTYFGPGDTVGAYVAVIGIFPPGEPAPPFHTHPNTDEAFYVAEGEATFLLGDRELTDSEVRKVLSSKSILYLAAVWLFPLWLLLAQASLAAETRNVTGPSCYSGR
jgi:hypothetical protein